MLQLYQLKTKSLIWYGILLTPVILGLSFRSNRIDDMIASAKQRCAKNIESSDQLYAEDFTWDYSYSEINSLFNAIYTSKKRLPNTLYYSVTNKSFMLPLGKDHDDLPVPDRFIKALITHVETALTQGYAEYVFLADLGHGHFYIPEDVFKQHINPKSPPREYERRIFEIVTQEKRVKIYYHSAEMFLNFSNENEFAKLPYFERFRNLHRNLVGAFDDGYALRLDRVGREPGSDLQGYTQVAQDIDLSSNKWSCIPFERLGRRMYFDISRFSPPVKNPPPTY